MDNATDENVFVNVSKESIIEQFFIKKYDVILLYVPVFLLALTANILVIAVVIKYHYMRSVTNYFLVNLSVADLLVTMVCMPIAAWDAYTMLWNFGEITCKIAKYLQGVSVASSVFTITAMAVDRYLAITQPFGFCRWFNKKTTIIVIIVLWITSMVVFAPLLFVGVTNEDLLTDNLTLVFCQETWDNFYISQDIFGIVCYIVMFAVPGAIMLFAYSLMGKKLCSVRPPFDNEGSCSTQQSYKLVRERKRVAWILLLLALVFAFCWLPYNTINLMIDTRNVKSLDVINKMSMMKPYMLLLGHANSALNPVIYCVMSRNFRRSVKELIFFTRVSFVSRRSNRMQWMDSTGSTLRANHHRLKILPTATNKRQLSRLQSSQKTTRTCAV
ncbi:hypothetical protein RI129_002137 [Pyrocoelia pectoralis]|uniref:G-protein coupled receptors family 1 profile domain-containing protein n=1 Tax=Pyrocoelia pectoralis TaxID=417401 RepID=A0AAN7VER0_9COLE